MKTKDLTPGMIVQYKGGYGRQHERDWDREAHLGEVVAVVAFPHYPSQSASEAGRAAGLPSGCIPLDRGYRPSHVVIKPLRRAAYSHGAHEAPEPVWNDRTSSIISDVVALGSVYREWTAETEAQFVKNWQGLYETNVASAKAKEEADKKGAEAVDALCDMLPDHAETIRREFRYGAWTLSPEKLRDLILAAK